MNKSEILDYIRTSPEPVDKRQIARKFKLKGSGPRVALKKILKELEGDGEIARYKGGGYSVPDGLPSVTVIEVHDIDIDGDVFARPVEWNAESQDEPPRIEVMPDNKGHPALSQGDRVLARLKRLDDGTYEARTIKHLGADDNQVLGLLRIHKRGAVLVPADKKAKYEFDIDQADLGEAKDGDLCIGEIKPARGQRNKKARIIKVLGRRDDPKAISLISLNEMGLREEFPEKVLKEAKKLQKQSPSPPRGGDRGEGESFTGHPHPNPPPQGGGDLGKGREDLRDIPLVTIDGEDARDFDDAVYAEPLDDGGFHLIVAIADVAYYVRPGSPLDIEAEKRGNSTYFPDRVVPMLPEALSNDLCSLRPDEDRACMAMHLWIDEHGELQKHKIVRGLMRSHARLIYEQVQHLYDKHNNPPSLKGGGKGEGQNFIDAHNPSNPHPNPPPQGGGDKVLNLINNLYAAYALLDKARQKRGALDLDLPERRIVIDDKGNMTGVEPRMRLDAHKLIEEFMILANVAAARALEQKKAPCVYRVHDRPSADKLDDVREFVQSFGLTMPKGQVTKPGQINGILNAAKKLPYSHLISQVMLRSQNQAVYQTENIGHFGLALAKYAHFTSPIRRYADLLVHRALISAYGLGPGGLDERGESRLNEVCQHISGTERTSMEAERNAIDRFTAAFLSEKTGATFTGKISGVTRFGLFVTLDESGADGLIPMRSLNKDFFVHDEKAHALVGRRSGIVYRLGAAVTVKLKEADGLTGSCVLELSGNSVNGADIPGMELSQKKQQKRTPKLDKRRKKKHNTKSRK